MYQSFTKYRISSAILPLEQEITLPEKKRHDMDLEESVLKQVHTASHGFNLETPV